MENSVNNESSELMEKILLKAQEDSTFREKLKTNPREVLMQESGESIPENIKIKIVDLDEVDLVVPLPAKQNDELSDDDLDNVSGGFFGLGLWGASKIPGLGFLNHKPKSSSEVGEEMGKDLYKSIKAKYK